MGQDAQIGGMVWDSVYHRIIISEVTSAAIYTIEPISGVSKVLSSAMRGAGPSFGQLGDLVLDADNERLLVIDLLANEIGVNRLLTEVDIASGDRTVVANDGAGFGPLTQVSSIAYDAFHNQVYLGYGSGVLNVNLFDGVHSVFSDAHQEVGFGRTPVHATTLHIDHNHHRLLLTDPLTKEVMAIDLATGDRNIIIDTQEFSQAGLCWVGDAVFFDDQLYVADATNQQILRLSLAAKAWQILVRTGAANETCMPAVVPAKEIAPIHDRRCKVLTTVGILADIAKSTNDAIISNDPIVRALLFPLVYGAYFVVTPTAIIMRSIYEVYSFIGSGPPTQDCVQFPGWVLVMAPLLFPVSLALVLFGNFALI